MSSILRALKKLESDPRHLEDTQPLANKFVPLADTSPRRSFTNIVLMTVGGGIICGLVFFTGWWVFTGKNQPASVSPINIPQQAAKSQKKPPEQKEALPPSLAPVVLEKPETPSSKNPVAERAAADQISEPEPLPLPEPALEKIEAEEAIQVKDVGEPAVSSEPETISQEPRKMSLLPEKREIAPPSPESGIPKAGTQAKKIEIPKLNDPDIKLQALTWSKEPSKRITVINNRILREGDMVSGYLVHTINQDDVILRREGKSWKLLFRTK